MKKHISWLPISILSISSAIAISSCSCNINIGYVAIPTDYLNISEDKTILDGFKDPEIDLSKYDTLQVPDSIVTVKGFNYTLSYISFNGIKSVLANNSGKWKNIESNCFSLIPELTKITLPKTIETIKENAFVELPKLNYIDLSNIQDISIIKSNQFSASGKYVSDGSIYVKSNDDKNYLVDTFKNNDWLKDWKYIVK